MEGLIPFVYRAIKKTKSRLSYRCLSSGAALRFEAADIHAEGRGFSTPQPEKLGRRHFFLTPPPEKLGGLWDERGGHRGRVSMLQEHPKGSGVRSHRRALTCIVSG